MLNKTYSDNALSIALCVSAAVWGFYWLPLRTIEQIGLSGAWSVVFFNACPLILLGPLLLFRLKILVGILWPTLLAALFIGLAFTLYANALVATTVVRATMLYFLTPIWSTLLGVLLLSEQLTKARVIAIGVAIFGLYLLLSGGDAAKYPLNMGDLFGFLSGIFWAFGLVVLNRWSSIPILPVASFVFACTTVVSVLFAVFFYGDAMPELSLLTQAFPTAAFWSIIIFLPCFLIVFRVSQVLFPGRVGILTMSEVIVAVLSAAILLPDEVMQPVQWIGAAAILLAGLVEVLFGYKRTSKQDSVTNDHSAQSL